MLTSVFFLTFEQCNIVENILYDKKDVLTSTGLNIFK